MSNSAQRRIRLRRDSQQWGYDRAVKETGRVYHFQPNGRGSLPESVKMHDMISKHLGRTALRFERLAAAEDAAGHPTTALEHYFAAAVRFGEAQHPVLVNNEEKKFLHAGALRCFEQVRRLAPYRIDRVEVPWNGVTLSGYLHHAPGEGPKPLVFMIPGCDMTKEFLPNPLYNWAGHRDVHLFVFDGPGQGECNIQDVALTIDNYEEAATVVLDHLVTLPEVDEDQLALYAMSFGSWWGVRFAAVEKRFKAAYFPWASICDKYYLFEEESPRYKQLFSFMTRIPTEAQLDEFIAQMGLEGIIDRISCPTLMTVGEYDPRSPLEEVYEHYDRMSAPKELWVFADQHHQNTVRTAGGAFWLLDTHSMGIDWIKDRLAGKLLERDGQVLYVEPTSPGPNAAAVPTKRHWYED